MPESFKYKTVSDRRAVFPDGKQVLYFLKVRKVTGGTCATLANEIGVHRRTFSDWGRGRYSVPLTILDQIAKISGVNIPKYVTVKKSYWWTEKGGHVSGTLVVEKYGRIPVDEKKRRIGWEKWYREKGRFSLKNHFVPKDILSPARNALLAEFVGIVLGDGGITARQVTITLSLRDDKKYSRFVAGLMKKLFGVDPSSRARNNSVIIIVVSRTRLVQFCESIGLKKGNKIRQQVDIPEWIKKNRLLGIACMRGLMDTDGCIFNECHKIKGKVYCYPRISFVSKSLPLRKSVLGILKSLGFIAKERNNRSINLEKREDIINYFRVVGTSNPKHQKRYNRFIGGVG